MKAKQKKRKLYWVYAVIAVVLAVGVLAFVLHGRKEKEDEGTDTDTGMDTGPETTSPTESDTIPETLGSDLCLESLGGYAGFYVEDGTNEIVSGIAAVTVKNEGEKSVQFLSFTVTNENGTEYSFQISTLLPGQRVTALDRNRQSYEYGAGVASVDAKSVVYFVEEPSLHPELFRLYSSENSITIENISSEPVPSGKICYKNVSGELLIGGITYTVSFPELNPGEKITFTPSHYSDGSSRILFVTYGES